MLQKTTTGKVKILGLKKLETIEGETFYSGYGIEASDLYGEEFDRVDYLPTNIDPTNPKGGSDSVNGISPYSNKLG